MNRTDKNNNTEQNHTDVFFLKDYCFQYKLSNKNRLIFSKADKIHVLQHKKDSRPIQEIIK